MKIYVTIFCSCYFSFYVHSYARNDFESGINSSDNISSYLNKGHLRSYLSIPLYRVDQTYYAIPNEIAGIGSLKSNEKDKMLLILSNRISKLPNWQARLSLEFHLIQIITHNGVFVSRNNETSIYAVSEPHAGQNEKSR